ncbi:DELLA protein [Marchantia polymorpha subsp. ruderalis]|uniref:Uncharacterized protein n=1 Tax=Marchantia polymorpha TaxID=3197 RepID=A0A2R6WR83_MARPO|nr:hypothetical protein MARPO_0064s0023 [Marchantia polymorpha]BBN18339.1 hypothetical protein Mp_8g01770 [Marchantia polymorpha subsp. ruderalis]|eukprot:PTQ36334.1 hypothetical protein MARPO_0064s0023 [Marchantia polymorpha]
MPPFANELDAISRDVQHQQHQQQQEDLEHADGVVLEREFPKYTIFFKINEPHKEEVAHCEQMVEVLQTAQILHGIRSESIGKLTRADISVWNPWSSAVAMGSSQDLLPGFEARSSEENHGAEDEDDEDDDEAQAQAQAQGDRQQLGSLLSGPLSPAAQAPGRKRSLCSMLESDDWLRSCTTSSESDPAASGGSGGGGEELDHESSDGPNKLAKTDQFQSFDRKIDRDLLSLSLPNSTTLSESSTTSSSRGSDAQQQAQAPLDDLDDPAFRSAPLLSLVTDGSSCPDRLAPAQARPAGAGGTSIRSFADAAAVRLTLSSSPSPSLSLSGGPRHEGKNGTRGPLHPLGGLDASRLNEHSLLMLDSDTGLEAHGLQLVNLLLKCADAAAKDNAELAAGILGELYQGASLYGDSMQRVAAYFAEGLAARIVSRDSAMYSSLMLRPSTGDYLSAFTTLYKVAPYFQFAHFTANQAILEAVEGRSAVHVVDLDIMQGFQWPSLIQALASRPGGPPHLRITGVGKHGDILHETGRRLASFAQSFDVSFEFQCLVAEKLECLAPEAFAPRAGEATAVNSILQLHRLLNPTSGEKLHAFVRSLCRDLHPCVLTIVEQEANHNSATFLGRFMEALHYYAAVFDSLDASLPQQNEERVKIEQLFFAQQIKNIVACEGDERVERHEPVDLWRKKMEMAGFYQIPLSSYAISQARLLLQFCPCEGYRLHERSEGSVSLGWQERQLLTASAWSC